MDSLLSLVRGISGREDFNDDFSMVELAFNSEKRG
jgi:hypothetical protein